MLSVSLFVFLYSFPPPSPPPFFFSILFCSFLYFTSFVEISQSMFLKNERNQITENYSLKSLQSRQYHEINSINITLICFPWPHQTITLDIKST